MPRSKTNNSVVHCKLGNTLKGFCIVFYWVLTTALGGRSWLLSPSSRQGHWNVNRWRKIIPQWWNLLAKPFPSVVFCEVFSRGCWWLCGWFLEDGVEEARLNKEAHMKNSVEYWLKLKNSVMLLPLFKLTVRTTNLPDILSRLQT